MTKSSAEKLANALIGVAVVGAAYYVIKTPPLRRLAWRLMVIAATGSLPGWLRQEIHEGWEASAHKTRAEDSGFGRDPARIGQVEG